MQLRKLLIAFLSSVFAGFFFGSVFGLILSFCIRDWRDSVASGEKSGLYGGGDKNALGGFFGGDPFGSGLINAFFIVTEDAKYSSSLSVSVFFLSWSSFVMLLTMLGRQLASKRNAGDLLMLFCEVLLELLSWRWNVGRWFTGLSTFVFGKFSGSFFTSLKRNLEKSIHVADRANFSCGSLLTLIDAISRASAIPDELFNFSNLDFINWTWLLMLSIFKWQKRHGP